MKGLNEVNLIGNLGKDPESKVFDNGNKIAMASLATSETFTKKDSSEKVTMTEWHNLVFRKGLADVALKYLKKGNPVFIKGKIRTRKWEANGSTHYMTEILVTDLNMLPTGQQSQSEGNANASNGHEEQDDDLPF